jgi:ABC-type uncharacterized transport system permease subunit
MLAVTASVDYPLRPVGAPPPNIDNKILIIMKSSDVVFGGGREGVETTLFEKGDLKITNHQVLCGEQVFLIEEITSVVIRKIGPKPTGGIGLLIIVLLVICIGFVNSDTIGAYARVGVWLLSGALLVLALMLMDETFTVWIITEEKVAEVFRSRKEAAAQKIVDILDKAMLR